MLRFQPHSALTYQLAKPRSPLPRPGIEEAFKGIVNKLRKYSASSIVDIALDTLWHDFGEPHEALQAAPWLTLLLVKWAVQDRAVALNVGPGIPLRAFDELRQQLWDLQGASHSGEQGFNVYVMLRKLLHPQLHLQRKDTWGFLRWPALYARLPQGTNNRRQFRDVMGLEPGEFMDLSFCLYAGVVGGSRTLEADFLVNLRSAYGAAVDQVYNLTVKDLPGLRAALQTDEALKLRGSRELFEFPYLRRYPLLKGRDGRLHCWHPKVFARGLEDAVHMRLSSLGEQYSGEFSDVFEDYVTELAVSMGIESLDEDAFKAVAGGHSTAVEVILKGNGCNILVEAKLTLFGDDALQDTEQAVLRSTKRVRNGIKQGWGVATLVREPEGRFADRFHAPKDFLIVVTSREMLIGTGERLKGMCPAGHLDYPNEVAREYLPLSNVIVMSIEDFELTVEYVKAGVVDLSRLLQEAVAANEHHATAWTMFSQVLAKFAAPAMVAPLIKDARDTSQARLEAALGKT